MKLKELLGTKAGISIELLVFFIIALSTIQLSVIIPLLVVLYIISMRSRRLKLISIGLDKSDITLKNIFLGILIAGIYHLLFNYLIEPSLDSWLPSSNLEAFGNIKGNIRQLLILLLTSWIIGAIFEELIFRGYLINRLIDFFGNSLPSKIVIVILASTAFGFIHFYQGMHGVISTGIFGVFQSIVFFMNRRKLLLPMIIHGTFDSISFILLYSGIS